MKIPVLYFLPCAAWMLCVLFCFNLQAQSIQGNVLEQSGDPLPYVNVLLLNSSDSSLVKGAVSNQSGYYKIENIYSGSYLMAATTVRYKVAYGSSIVIASNDVEVTAPLVILPEEAKQLDEVTIGSEEELQRAN